ncbi:MAG: NUDIX hydrolase [Acidimicrobiales bacterium]
MVEVDDRGVVRAAGAVVWRRGAEGVIEVLLVHRPKYDDWAFPKGKCNPDEDDPSCAMREVEEEAGLRGELGDELPSTEYVDPKGRPKRVRYWAMTIHSGRFEPNDEIDEIQWVPATDVAVALSYPRDAAVVQALIDRLAQAPPSPATSPPVEPA